MLRSQAETLIEAYLKWLRTNLRTEEVNGAIVIDTPFLDRHHDEIELFLEQRGDEYHLSDDGYTIRDLRSSGVDLTRGSRNARLTRILNGFGVAVTGDELWVRSTVENFPQKKHNLVQAILSVDDLFVTGKEEVFQFFREDVEDFLRHENVPIFRDVKLSGKSGFDHHFDVGLPADAHHSERVLQAINTLRRDSVTNLAFAIDDVRKQRHSEDLGAFAIINDTEKSPPGEYLDALRNYGVTPLLWSERTLVKRSIIGYS